MEAAEAYSVKPTLKAAIDYICNSERKDNILLAPTHGFSAEIANIEFA